MAIRIRCYKCHEEIRLEFPEPGTSVFCPYCGQPLIKSFSAATNGKCPECGEKIGVAKISVPCPDCGALYHESCMQKRLSEGRECVECARSHSNNPFASPIISAPPPPVPEQTETSSRFSSASEGQSHSNVVKKPGFFARMFQNISNFFEQQRQKYDDNFDSSAANSDNDLDLLKSSGSIPPAPPSSSRWSSNENLQPVKRPQKTQSKPTAPTPPPLKKQTNANPSIKSKGKTLLYYLPTVLSGAILVYLGFCLSKSGAFQYASLFGGALVALGIMFMLLRTPFTKRLLISTGIFSMLIGLTALAACGYMSYSSPQADPGFWNSLATAGVLLLALFFVSRWNKAPSDKTERSRFSAFVPFWLVLILGTAAFAGWNQFQVTRIHDIVDYLARRGVADAQYLQGNYYLDDKLPSFDEEEALSWYDKAADQKYILANAKAAQMYHDGTGNFFPDSEKAFQNWEIAANGGHVESMVRLGDCYLTGDGCQSAPVQAASYYLKAAEKNSPEGQYKLALSYFTGKGVAANNSEGRFWLEKSAEAEYPEAMYELGVRSVLGSGMPINYNQGLDWLERAALKEHSDAQEFLEQFYIYGSGLEKVPERTITWLVNASEKSDPAKKALNRYFIENDGLKKFPNQGVQWLLQEANRNNPIAQNLIGECYRDGIGVSKSNELAVEWFEKAADNRNSAGQYNLGKCYLDGAGVTADNVKAFELFLKSANNGFVDSMYELGLCYFNGCGTQQDKPLATQWFYEAAQNGNKPAAEMLDKYFIEQNGLLDATQIAVNWLKKRAKQGVAEAQEKLDEFFISDIGLSNNPKEAIATLLKRAQMGDASSQTKLGNCYLLGTGVRKNVNTAIEWLYKAACQDYQPAKIILDQYSLSSGMQTPEFSIRWITQRAREDYLPAQLYLGSLYLDNSSDSDYFNPNEGIQWLERAAQQGAQEAPKRLEQYYLSETAILRTPAKCVEWLSSQNENAKAQYLLSQYYRKGIGNLKPNNNQANIYLERAAQLGDNAAQYELGNGMCTGTIGSKVDAETGYSWLHASAKNGNAQAQYEVGMCNLNGIGTDQNSNVAVKFFELAANQGLGKAQYQLGKCLSEGKGAAKNDVRAAALFRSAAGQGIPEASYEYGLCCRDGRGCSVNKVEAWNSFCTAADAGLSSAVCEKGKCLLKGFGTAQKFEEGFQVLKQAYGSGCSEAQEVLDDFCLNDSRALSFVPEETAQWLIKRSDEGLSQAGQKLDSLYVKQGDSQTLPQAGIIWIKKSAANGNPEAQLKLANMYKENIISENGADADMFNLYRKSSQKGTGDPEAIYNLGSCYDSGRGTAVDKIKAKQCFELAAQKGYPLANQALGQYYYYGDVGIEKNRVKAAVYLVPAAEAGLLPSQYLLGICYQSGDGVSKNLSEAIKWLSKPAQQGDIKAQAALADCYLMLGQPENAIEWLEISASQGVCSAQRNLGLCYLYGDGVNKSLSKAVSWLSMASKQNDAIAQTALGECYQTGTGVNQDLFEAIRLFRSAASPNADYPQGYPKALYLLGKAYLEGQGVSINYKIAEEYLQKAANLGYTEANVELQEYYLNKGMDENPDKAVQFIKARAEAGDPVAQVNYGKCFFDGKGVKKDLENAFNWFQKSARQDCPEGLYMLGLCYYQGWGVSADPTKASPLFKKAVRLSGHQNAKRKLEEMGLNNE